jgi:glutamate 5-kinase
LVPKKRWLGFSTQPSGKLVVDDGAAQALRESASSLLPIGIVRVDGEFNKGEVVAVHTSDGGQVAKGLSNYSASDLMKICGLRTPQIAEILGHCPYAEAIHRDNLTLI